MESPRTPHQLLGRYERRVRDDLRRRLVEEVRAPVLVSLQPRLKPIYWKPVFWSRSYCIISVGGAPLSVLRQYIEQQAGVGDRLAGLGD